MTCARVLLAVLFLAGCSSDNGGADGGGSRDLSAGSGDLGVGDLAGPVDATCRFGTFAGFFGAATNEQRFDCPCGCTIDTFEESAVSGLWNGSVQSSMLHGTSTGLEVTPEPPDGGTAFAGLSSVNPNGRFFLDGDFDLLIDYQLVTPLPPDGHASLQVNDLTQNPNGVYTVERSRQMSGESDYSTQLAGILPVNMATSATASTLELTRMGTVVRAVADGKELSRYTGAIRARLAIVLGVGVGSCAGAGCSFTVKWHNLRLQSGSLVDRQ